MGRARTPFRPAAFQPVERDFAFVVGADVAADAVLRAARSADKTLIADASLFDVYQGAGIGVGKKSVALSVTLQPLDRTLTDAEIEAIAQMIVKAVGQATGAVLRQ
jgi:phenylalanyl-tRNA synthetase beta chain